jgi:hypothetical protein
MMITHVRNAAYNASVMLNRVLWKQFLRPALYPALQRRPDNVVKQERAIYQEDEAEHL